MDNNNIFDGTQEGSTYDSQNPYASPYSAQSSQGVYSSTYDAQSTQGTYSSAGETQNTQGTYSFTGDTQNTQGTYSSAGETQKTQRPYQAFLEAQNNPQNQYAYESQINNNSYSFENQNTQNSQNNQSAQNTSYTYGSNANGGAPNYYASDYTYNVQNTAYQGYQTEMEKTVPMSDWLLLVILLSIPCIGLIMAIVWAFSKTENQNKVNFCKAYLVLYLIGLVFAIVIAAIFGGIILSYLGF